MISLEYLAGFIDGEGNISIVINKTHNRIYTSLVIKITNTNLKILKLIQEVYGGRIQINNHANLFKNWKESYCLVFCGDLAFSLLQKLESYIIVKQNHLNLALKYWAFHRQSKEIRCDIIPGGYRKCQRYKIKKEIIDQELLFAYEMRKLNYRGRASV